MWLIFKGTKDELYVVNVVAGTMMLSLSPTKRSLAVLFHDGSRMTVDVPEEWREHIEEGLINLTTGLPLNLTQPPTLQVSSLVETYQKAWADLMKELERSEGAEGAEGTEASKPEDNGSEYPFSSMETMVEELRRIAEMEEQAMQAQQAEEQQAEGQAEEA